MRRLIASVPFSEEKIVGHRYWRTLLVMCALHAGAAVAQNMVLNADFDSDLGHWSTNSSNAWSVDNADGFPAPGSAHMVGSTEANTGLQSDCIVVGGGQSIDLIANVKDASMFSRAVMSLRSYSDGTCSSISSDLFVFNFPTPLGNGWTQGSLTTLLPAGIGSVTIFLETSGFGGTADTRWDHIRFGPTGSVPVRLQSFEVVSNSP